MNNNGYLAQFTLVDNNSQAIARCGVIMLSEGRYPCAGAIDDGQCHTNIKWPKDEL